MYNILNISKKFGNLEVLKCININISQNKIVSILGPSGCGKTTLLNILSGVLQADGGIIEGFKGKKISYLFQDLRLINWLTVYENVAFVLKDIYAKKEVKKIAHTYIKQVGLIDYVDYYPKQLSGGMQQRVSIARAFAYPSSILLMDEPFKSLDFDLKNLVISNFKKMWLNDKRTVIFITHDIQSAVLLGDNIYLLTDKPTVVSKKYINPVPINDRNFKNEDLINLQQQIYLDF